MWCMLLLAILPVALRLALLHRASAPVPATADDTSYLLLADTLSHFRLANPPHPFARFFETNFVLQDPTYSSIFPLGQGIALALGKLVFGHPWAGVLLAGGLLCAMCYWMLRAWISPAWALAGGFLAVMQFGPLSYWTNSYWGGAVSGIAGCLVFGALPRRNGWLIGLGLGLELLTRPYEFLLLTAAVPLTALPFQNYSCAPCLPWGRLPNLRRVANPPGVALSGMHISLKAAAALVPAIALTLLHNHAVTGSWTTLPYQLSRHQYGTPTTFTFQPNPSPNRNLSQEEQDNYDAQSAVHARESRIDFGKRFLNRLSNLRFFFSPPLYLALPAFLFTLRDARMLSLLIPVAAFLIGTNFYPYVYAHYIAAITCVFLLMTVAGLDRVSRSSKPAAALIFLLAVAHFAFWYGLHAAAGDRTAAAMLPFESSDYLNRGDPEGRVPVSKRLAESPGKQLVFVRFGPVHPLREWIANEANIDQSRVVWALDLGRSENEKLRQYYSDRTTWLLEADDHPPNLQPYPNKPQIHFEPVPPARE
ncbi:MAG: hypothetical protein JO062_08340 [Bryobacterales bacterium]|nr:hypothetical protein [Bryobacterales bacterium]